MLQHIRQTSILNKIFNVNVNEWPKIGLAWTINFFYRIGFVLGWTVIVAMFVSRYGIASLPLLFILNAGFAVIGSVLYSSILEKFGKEQIMIATIFAAGGLLFGAMKILPYSEVFFFALVIVAISVFLAQFKINFISYVEEMFNPLQSARTFPLIEASETIGGIGAGLVITLFSAGLPIVSLIYLWIALLFFIVPLLLFHGVPIKEEHLSNDKKIGFVSKLKEAFSKAHERSYIKGLFYIVFLQWILFNLLEFQYTSAVFDNLSHVVRDTGSGFEHALFHDLGTLSVLFSCSALLIQLFLGSRLIGSLGIFGSMLLHPIVTLLSMIGLTGKFTFLTAILAKNNFTITTVVHTNAYHSAYYAVDEKARSYVRELLEGIVRPVGAIIGTLILIILEKFFAEGSLIFYVNLFLVLIAAIMFYVTYFQQIRYTKMAVHDLEHGENLEERMNAVDILGQRGHWHILDVLRKILHDAGEKPELRLRVLHTLGELTLTEAMEDLIICFHSKNAEIRAAALDALARYRIFSSKKEIFVKWNLFHELEDLYERETDEENISRIIFILSKISNLEVVEFLLGVLKKADVKHKHDAIMALGKFEDDGVVKFIAPFLQSKNPEEQMSAAIALAAFNKTKLEARELIAGFLNSRDSEKLAWGIYAAGELKIKDKKYLCHKYLTSKDKDLRMQAAAALVKFGDQVALQAVLDILVNAPATVSGKLKSLLRNLDGRTLWHIEKMYQEALFHKNNS